MSPEILPYTSDTRTLPRLDQKARQFDAIHTPHESAERNPIGCVAVFIVRYGQVLVGKRIHNTTVEGVPELCIPGGKIDWMEKPEEAVVREVREETGLIVGVDSFMGYNNDTFSQQDLHFITLYFQAHVIFGSPRPMEPTKCSDWYWKSPATVDKLFANAHEKIPSINWKLQADHDRRAEEGSRDLGPWKSSKVWDDV